MLVAQRKNGERFSLGDWLDKNVLVKKRKNEEFFCPECGETVILKLGNKRIWHFSHQKGASCPQQYERESDYHLSGKLQMYRWLLERGVKAELEKFFSCCRQRADIAFILETREYVIEFQCSPISEDLFKDRTEGYLSNGITPIWILGGNQLKRLASNVISFNHFQYLFLRKQLTGWGFSAYCPESHQFIFLHHILPISPKKAIVSMAAFPKSRTHIVDLLNPIFQQKVSLDLWTHELQKLKMSYFIYPDLQQRTFLNDLYQNRLNLQTFPPEIGLPVLSAPFIETSPLVWQTYLYLDIFRHLRKGSTFSISNAYTSFFLRMKRGQIKCRMLPLNDKGSFQNAVEEYLTLLVKLSTLRRIDHNTYQMVRPFGSPMTVDAQLNEERMFYQTHERSILEHLIGN